MNAVSWKASMAEWLRRSIRNRLGVPAQVRILFDAFCFWIYWGGGEGCVLLGRSGGGRRLRLPRAASRRRSSLRCAGAGASRRGTFLK